MPLNTDKIIDFLRRGIVGNPANPPLGMLGNAVGGALGRGVLREAGTIGASLYDIKNVSRGGTPTSFDVGGLGKIESYQARLARRLKEPGKEFEESPILSRVPVGGGENLGQFLSRGSTPGTEIARTVFEGVIGFGSAGLLASRLAGPDSILNKPLGEIGPGEIPAGLYVKEEWRTTIKKGSTKEVANSLANYVRQRGTLSGEKQSQFFIDATERLAKDLKMKAPVLPEDRLAVLEKAASKFPDLFTDMPTVPVEAPIRSVAGEPSILEQTPEEQMALYRFKQGRTWTLDDQWKTFKETSINLLRRAGAKDDVLDVIRKAPRGSAERGEFALELEKSLTDYKLPRHGETILEAASNGVDYGYKLFTKLKAGKDFEPIGTSPLTDVEALFKSARSASVNKDVAERLTAEAAYWAQRGDSFKKAAFERAAASVTGKGSPNLQKLFEEGGEGALSDLPGIGPRIAKRLGNYFESGSWPELETFTGGVGVPKVPKFRETIHAAQKSKAVRVAATLAAAGLGLKAIDEVVGILMEPDED